MHAVLTPLWERPKGPRVCPTPRQLSCFCIFFLLQCHQEPLIPTGARIDLVMQPTSAAAETTGCLGVPREGPTASYPPKPAPMDQLALAHGYCSSCLDPKGTTCSTALWREKSRRLACHGSATDSPRTELVKPPFPSLGLSSTT